MALATSPDAGFLVLGMSFACLLAFCLLACLVGLVGSSVGWLAMWWCGGVCLLSRASLIAWMVDGYAQWWVVVVVVVEQ